MRFVVRKFAGRWSFGTAEESFVTFDTKERAIEHAKEIVRRIPGTELEIADQSRGSATELGPNLR